MAEDDGSDESEHGRSLGTLCRALGETGLPFHYLSTRQYVSMWSHGDKVVIEWDEGSRKLRRQRTWAFTAPRRGRCELDREKFLADTRAFGRALHEQMGERVRQVRNHWSRPYIELDLDAHEIRLPRERNWAAAIEVLRRYAPLWRKT